MNVAFSHFAYCTVRLASMNKTSHFHELQNISMFTMLLLFPSLMLVFAFVRFLLTYFKYSKYKLNLSQSIPCHHKQLCSRIQICKMLTL